MLQPPTQAPLTLSVKVYYFSWWESCFSEITQASQACLPERWHFGWKLVSAPGWVLWSRSPWRTCWSSSSLCSERELQNTKSYMLAWDINILLFAFPILFCWGSKDHGGSYLWFAAAPMGVRTAGAQQRPQGHHSSHDNSPLFHREVKLQFLL